MALSSTPDGQEDEFDLARKRSKQQAQSNLQQQQQALKRRFAVLGTGASGARLKAEEKAQTQYGEQVAGAEEQIGTAERAENRRVREIGEARQFATSERLGSQEFAKGERIGSQDFGAQQAEIQRKYQTGERLSSQEFSSVQADIQRKYLTGERISSQEYATVEREASQQFADAQRQYQEAFAAGESGLARDAARQMFDAQMGLEVNKLTQAQQQFADTFGEEKRVNDANIAFNERILKLQEKGGIFDQLGGGKLFPGLSSDWKGGGDTWLDKLKMSGGGGGGGGADPLKTIQSWF